MANIDIRPLNVIKEVDVTFNFNKRRVEEELKRRIREHKERQEKSIHESEQPGPDNQASATA